MRLPPILANAVVALVSLVWAGNFVAGVLLPTYRGDPALNFVFMTIVGGALALRGDGAGSASGLAARLGAALRPPPEPPAPAPPAAPEERP